VTIALATFKALRATAPWARVIPAGRRPEGPSQDQRHAHKSQERAIPGYSSLDPAEITVRSALTRGFRDLRTALRASLERDLGRTRSAPIGRMVRSGASYLERDDCQPNRAAHASRHQTKSVRRPGLILYSDYDAWNEARGVRKSQWLTAHGEASEYSMASPCAIQSQHSELMGVRIHPTPMPCFEE
jgi:hypothetical protein